MKFEKREPSGREKDEAAIELLNKLKEKLYSDNVSTARLAAFNLSWMQEDGFDILKEALLGNFPRTAKKAAAYGLRSMKGRMKKVALEVLEQGLQHRDRTTRTACSKALLLLKDRDSKKAASKPKPRPAGPKIREIPSKRAGKTKPTFRETPSTQ